MKIVKVIPIYKTGAKDELNNYRPISLNPQFSKILEMLFDDRLKKFICKNNILTDCQFCFQTGRSSSMAIFYLMEKISNSLDNIKAVISVFIDLKNAFDTIDYTILLQKLNHYGISGIVIQSVCPDAPVVHASGSGQLQANPHVAGPWLSSGKPTRRAVTTMGSNDLVIGEDHML